MPTVKQIAGQFIGAAKQNPNSSPKIFREAAQTFAGLAMDPKNAHMAKRLHNVALDFAQAASRERPPTMGDFADLLQETKAAYDEVGDDAMDLIARRREIHDERTSDFTQVSITPASFNKDATLGRSAVIQSFVGMIPDEIAAAKKNGIADTQTVAFWQGVKKEAQAVTVDVALVLLPALLAGTGEVFALKNNRPYGLVEFGSDGNRTTVKFDIGNGKRFTVVGNYVSVSVGMDPPRPGDTSTPLTVGASIGVFGAPSEAPLILSGYVDELKPGDDFIVPIPLKAAFLLPLLSTLALGETAILTFLDVGGDIMYQVFYLQSNTSSMPTISLMGDVSFIKIHNAIGNIGVANFRLPFQLSL